MAYDLILKRQTPGQFARGQGAAPIVAGGAGLLATIALFLLPRLRRRSEIQQYRREYAHDYYGNKPIHRLARTQELPAIPMAELIEQRDDR